MLELTPSGESILCSPNRSKSSVAERHQRTGEVSPSAVGTWLEITQK